MEEKALYAKLIADSAVTSLIDSRLYPLYPQEEPTYPFAVYTRANTEPLYSLDGRERPFRIDIQVDVWANDYASLKAITQAIEESLDQYRGTIAGITVQLIEAGDKTDEQDQENLKYTGRQVFSLYA